jgi:hypothetical protein
MTSSSSSSTSSCSSPLAKKDNQIAPLDSLLSCSPIDTEKGLLFLHEGYDVDDAFGHHGNATNGHIPLNLKNTNTSSTYTLTDTNPNSNGSIWADQLHTRPTYTLPYTVTSPTSKSKLAFNSADVELLSKLLDSQAGDDDQRLVDRENRNKQPSKTVPNQHLSEIQCLTQKFYTAPLNSDAVKIDSKYKFQTFSFVEKIKDLNLLSTLKDQKMDAPTTPPPSPIMTLDENDGGGEYDPSLASDCESMVTPPGTPTHDHPTNHEPGFSLNQLLYKLLPFNKLSKFDTQIANNNTQLIKPKPLYASHSSESRQSPDKGDNEPKADKHNLPSTPPSSPLMCASPVPSCLNLAFNEDNSHTGLKDSAFVRVSTLNPLLGGTGCINLASLLSSLSTMRRNQRLTTIC